MPSCVNADGSPGACKPSLSPLQIAALAYQAGWRGDDLVRAISVALAESSGIPNVANASGHYGLWQIDTSLHGVSVADAIDPQKSTADAYGLFFARNYGQGPDHRWDDWANDGNAAFIGQATTAYNRLLDAIDSGQLGGLVGILKTVTDSLPDVSTTPGSGPGGINLGTDAQDAKDAAGALGQLVTVGLGKQVLFVLLGLVLLLVGVYLLINPGGQIADALKAGAGETHTGGDDGPIDVRVTELPEKEGKE